MLESLFKNTYFEEHLRTAASITILIVVLSTQDMIALWLILAKIEGLVLCETFDFLLEWDYS